ncbi:hypothetical protein P6C57_005119, partial [Escherichia coli]|nr:hypothetical protein [Escherichia coli]
MDSAKEIARDMLESVNINGDGFLGAVGKGLISLPVSLGYMGYDFTDTGHRRENQDDKFRMARLVEKGIFSRDIIGKIISICLEDFVSRINMEKIGSIV